MLLFRKEDYGGVIPSAGSNFIRMSSKSQDSCLISTEQWSVTTHADQFNGPVAQEEERLLGKED